MVTEFNKVNIKNIHRKLDEMLKAFGDENGITITSGALKYDSGTFKVPVSAVISSQKAESDEKVNAMLEKLGIPRGTELLINNTLFIVDGYDATKPKNDVKIKRKYDGKPFRTSLATAKQCIHKLNN